MLYHIKEQISEILEWKENLIQNSKTIIDTDILQLKVISLHKGDTAKLYKLYFSIVELFVSQLLDLNKAYTTNNLHCNNYLPEFVYLPSFPTSKKIFNSILTQLYKSDLYINNNTSEKRVHTLNLKITKIPHFLLFTKLPTLIDLNKLDLQCIKLPESENQFKDYFLMMLLSQPCQDYIQNNFITCPTDYSFCYPIEDNLRSIRYYTNSVEMQPFFKSAITTIKATELLISSGLKTKLLEKALHKVSNISEYPDLTSKSVWFYLQQIIKQINCNTLDEHLKSYFTRQIRFHFYKE